MWLSGVYHRHKPPVSPHSNKEETGDDQVTEKESNIDFVRGGCSPGMTQRACQDSWQTCLSAPKIHRQCSAPPCLSLSPSSSVRISLAALRTRLGNAAAITSPQLKDTMAVTGLDSGTGHQKQQVALAGSFPLGYLLWMSGRA